MCYLFLSAILFIFQFLPAFCILYTLQFQHPIYFNTICISLCLLDYIGFIVIKTRILRKKPSGVHRNELDVVLVAEFSNLDFLIQIRIGEDNNLQDGSSRFTSE